HAGTACGWSGHRLLVFRASIRKTDYGRTNVKLMLLLPLATLVAALDVGTAAGQSALENPARETSGGFGILPSLDYASGKYGTPDRTITRAFSLTVLYDQPNYTLTLTLPYISKSGPGGSILVRTD